MAGDTRGPSGYVILDKEGGMTSQRAVRRLMRLFSAAKGGHTGTLDPEATGVLPVLLGRATKASDFLLSSEKRYEAVLLLGRETDTEDVFGTTLAEHEGPYPDEESVLSALSAFRGEILQVPPMVSALKRDGKKLCDLARAGITVEREARGVTVFSLTAERLDARRYRLSAHVGGGTYIRTLCADVGRALGVGGCMESLRRTEAAGFSVQDAVTLSSLEEMSEEERLTHLHPTEALFLSLPEVIMPPFFARLSRAGLAIEQRKLSLSYPLSTRLRLRDEAGFYALGEVVETEGGLALKPIRAFAE